MATDSEITMDALWDEMKDYAVEQQQCFYELIFDCMLYKAHEHKYLKQNIGYAIYGPPKNKEEGSLEKNIGGCYSNEETQNEDADITDTVDYDKEATTVIDKIYNKICECATGSDETQSIYFSIIYNVIFRPKKNIKPQKKEEKKVTKKEEITGEEEINKFDVEKLFIVIPIPIFKVWRNGKEKTDTTKNMKKKEALDDADYEISYIDTSCREYKSWTDYKTNNQLPKCTMVLPKDGYYQPDPSYPVTEDYSTVWLEIIDSPQCSLGSMLCNGMDCVSGAVGIGTVGVGIASLFTPLAPAVIVAGLAATAATGTWTTARCIQQLIDRRTHGESIHLLNKDAFPQWLGIAGSFFGLGAAGGAAAISNAVARGMTIHAVARIAFNIVQGGNLLVNGIGIVYQGYYIVDKYKKEKTINYMDALNLATHVMFFAGSVIKIQFAGDIISETQGKILNDYRDNLHSRRLRKRFNRTNRQASVNNTCEMSKNAEVIRYIRNRTDLSSFDISNNRAPEKIAPTLWSIERGILKIGSIKLLDPIEFVNSLSRIFTETDINNKSSSGNNIDDNLFDHLMRVLCKLLTDFCLSSDYPKSNKLPIVSDFEPLLKEMCSANMNEDFLKKIFSAAVKIFQRSRNADDFLIQSFRFLWLYCKSNLKQWGIKSSYRLQSFSASKILQKIITAIVEAIDIILDNLYDALEIYIRAKLRNQVL